MSCLTFGTKKLRPHQIRVVKTLFTNFSILAAHGTGTGKTLTAIAAAECLLHMNKVTHIIVATPRALVDNFWKELLIFSDFVDVSKYTIGTYQRIEKMFKQNPEFFTKAFLIVDEAHNLRTKYSSEKVFDDGRVRREKGGLGRNFIKMSWKVNKVLLLTATPVVNYVDEFNNLYNMLVGHTKKIQQFMKVFEDNGLKNTCPKNEQGVKFPSVDIYQRNVQDENFPKVTRRDEVMVMNGNYLKDYVKLEEAIDSGLEPFAFMMKLRAALNRMGVGDDVYKIAFVIHRLLKNKNLKTVVYSQFLTNGIDLMTTILDKKKIHYFLITGKTKKQDIKLAVDNFNKKKRGGILFISKAGGEGLDLKGVREMILLEPFWNESNETQAVGRAVRFKSHNHLPPAERIVNIIRIVLKKPRGWVWQGRPSVDEYLVALAKKKQYDIKKFLDCF